MQFDSKAKEFLEAKEEIIKKLKATKHRIVLSDGRELQYHLPMRRSEALSLRSHLPEEAATLPLEVEIGPGKGEFIAARAALHPERFFVGIDRRQDRFDLTEKKLLRKTEGKNWVLIRDDARGF